MAGLQQRKRSADHNGRVFFRRHHDVRTHGRRCGLTVRTGNAQRVLISAHERSPSLRALKDRNAAAMRLVHLRVIIVHGSRADHKGNVIRDIVRTVADMDRDAALTQRERVAALGHIRTADVQPGVMQHFRQRRHGHAADTDQQAGLSGNQVILKIHSKHQIS